MNNELNLATVFSFEANCHVIKTIHPLVNYKRDCNDYNARSSIGKIFLTTLPPNGECYIVNI